MSQLDGFGGGDTLAKKGWYFFSGGAIRRLQNVSKCQ